MSLLLHLFVCISFQWNVSKLGYLEQSVSTVLTYPTRVNVCVVTDAPVRLERVLARWGMKDVWVCDESRSLLADSHPYALVWRHRDVLANAAKSVFPAYSKSLV